MSCLDCAGCFPGLSRSSAFFAGLSGRCLSDRISSARRFAARRFSADSLCTASLSAASLGGGSFTTANLSCGGLSTGRLSTASFSAGRLSTSDCGCCRSLRAGSSGGLCARRRSFHLSAGGTLSCCGCDLVGAEIQPLCKCRQHC